MQPLILGEHEFTSRLLTGTGRFSSLQRTTREAFSPTSLMSKQVKVPRSKESSFKTST